MRAGSAVLYACDEAYREYALTRTATGHAFAGRFDVPSERACAASCATPDAACLVRIHARVREAGCLDHAASGTFTFGAVPDTWGPRLREEPQMAAMSDGPFVFASADAGGTRASIVIVHPRGASETTGVVSTSRLDEAPRAITMRLRGGAYVTDDCIAWAPDSTQPPACTPQPAAAPAEGQGRAALWLLAGLAATLALVYAATRLARGKRRGARRAAP